MLIQMSDGPFVAGLFQYGLFYCIYFKLLLLEAGVGVLELGFGDGDVGSGVSGVGNPGHLELFLEQIEAELVVFCVLLGFQNIPSYEIFEV